MNLKKFNKKAHMMGENKSLREDLFNKRFSLNKKAHMTGEEIATWVLYIIIAIAAGFGIVTETIT